MAKIGFPQDAIDADILAHLDAHRFEPEVDVDLAAKQFARARGDTLGPKMILFPLVIAGFQHRADPAQPGFSKDPVEPGEFFEQAGKDQ